jgi:uncharacterized protein (TIGR02246 family)
MHACRRYKVSATIAQHSLVAIWRKMLTHLDNKRPDEQTRRNVYHRVWLALSLLILACGIAHAATANETAIRNVLDTQVAAWNRGDIVAFMQGYRNSPATTFVGKTVQHGYANILARYQKTYGSKDSMGQLSFTDLDVHQLDAHFAAVTGRYQLARSASAGGNAEGVFSLIFEKTESGWKIILDHTS